MRTKYHTLAIMSNKKRKSKKDFLLRSENGCRSAVARGRQVGSTARRNRDLEPLNHRQRFQILPAWMGEVQTGSRAGQATRCGSLPVAGIGLHCVVKGRRVRAGGPAARPTQAEEEKRSWPKQGAVGSMRTAHRLRRKSSTSLRSVTLRQARVRRLRHPLTRSCPRVKATCMSKW